MSALVLYAWVVLIIFTVLGLAVLVEDAVRWWRVERRSRGI